MCVFEHVFRCIIVYCVCDVRYSQLHVLHGGALAAGGHGHVAVLVAAQQAVAALVALLAEAARYRLVAHRADCATVCANVVIIRQRNQFLRHPILHFLLVYE